MSDNEIIILLSMNPKWNELIFSGIKTVEVRKTVPKVEKFPFKCLIYETKTEYFQRESKCRINGIGKVIGEFTCDAIIQDRTWGHNDVFRTAACMSDAERAFYCINSTMYLLSITNPIRYDRPKDLSEFGLSRPPQSWCYIRRAAE